MLPAMREWLNANKCLMRERNYSFYLVFEFEDEDEALAFKLVWYEHVFEI